MKSSMKCMCLLILGIILGGVSVFMYFHKTNYQDYVYSGLVEKVLKYSNQMITDENNSCEGEPINTVGDVVASLLEMNKYNKVNMLSYGCFNDTCTMSLSTCQPWDGEECSSRFLKFNINEQSEIRADSFVCFDMP